MMDLCGISFKIPVGQMRLLVGLSLLVISAIADLTQKGWGVNIHFTDGKPGEVSQVSEGFRLTRMDFTWAAIEVKLGIYDFSAYDRLLSELKAAPFPVLP